MTWLAGLEHEIAELSRAQKPDDNRTVRRGGLGPLGWSMLMLAAVLSIAGISAGLEDGAMVGWRWGERTAHAQIQNAPTDVENTRTPKAVNQSHLVSATPRISKLLSPRTRWDNDSATAHPVLFSGNVSDNFRLCVSISLFFIDAAHHKSYGESVPKMVSSMKRLGSGWVLWVFADDTIRPTLVNAINHAAKTAGTPVQWRFMPRSHVRSGTFWRFFAFDKCNVTIFRDAELTFESNDDFILQHFFASPRQIAAVQLAHPRTWAQHRPVLAGAYIMKNVDRTINMTALVTAWPYWHYYGADEVFIGHMVHPLRPSIMYYEPRKKIIETVKLDGMDRYEEYVSLPSCYESTPPC